jgi:hypothetical protein
MGVMAEAEFYSLFTKIFHALDQDNPGCVRTGDLDKVLGGVRDLISNDWFSLSFEQVHITQRVGPAMVVSAYSVLYLTSTNSRRLAHPSKVPTRRWLPFCFTRPQRRGNCKNCTNWEEAAWRVRGMIHRQVFGSEQMVW